MIQTVIENIEKDQPLAFFLNGNSAKIIQAGKKRIISEMYNILIILGRRRNELNIGGR